MLNLPPYSIFPQIISGNIVLRQVEPDDIKHLVEISFYDAKPAQTLEEAIVMQNRINADYQNGNSIHWCIMDKTTREVMGTLGYYRGFTNASGELGCILKPAFRGKGIMTSAIKLAAGFGSDTIGLKKVIAITTRQNTKAVRLLERLNFIKTKDLEDDELEYQFQKPSLHSMEHRIELLTGKKLVGKHLTMSLTNNKTAELWRSFMMQRKEIFNAIGTNLYSMQIYDASHFNNFDPANSFEKWAATEVTDFGTIPNGMESFLLPAGLYAVFRYKGSSTEGAKVFQYIFGTWLPNSGYILDNRPHFELLGENYKNESPDSEEEIWIPVKT